MQRLALQRKLWDFDVKSYIFGLSWLDDIQLLCAELEVPFSVAPGEADREIALDAGPLDGVLSPDFDFLVKGYICLSLFAP